MKLKIQMLTHRESPSFEFPFLSVNFAICELIITLCKINYWICETIFVGADCRTSSLVFATFSTRATIPVTSCPGLFHNERRLPDPVPSAT